MVDQPNLYYFYNNGEADLYSTRRPFVLNMAARSSAGVIVTLALVLRVQAVGLAVATARQRRRRLAGTRGGNDDRRAEP